MRAGPVERSVCGAGRSAGSNSLAKILEDFIGQLILFVKVFFIRLQLIVMVTS
jgi:hypothetical protein